ncbi:MAG: DUF305 domain-containing protein [Pseudomonadota bacterium]
MESMRNHGRGGHGKPYLRLLVMAGLHGLAMYGLMYAMVASAADILPNANQLYMATLMTAPMVLLELLLMGAMYRRKPLNGLTALGCIVVLAGAFMLIRQQTFIDDRQLLKSMIPHHSGAILMCGQARLRDAEVRALCESIIASQSREIAQMKTRLAAMEGGEAR